MAAGGVIGAGDHPSGAGVVPRRPNSTEGIAHLHTARTLQTLSKRLMHGCRLEQSRTCQGGLLPISQMLHAVGRLLSITLQVDEFEVNRRPDAHPALKSAESMGAIRSCGNSARCHARPSAVRSRGPGVSVTSPCTTRSTALQMPPTATRAAWKVPLEMAVSPSNCPTMEGTSGILAHMCCRERT